jgi:hypothetical protein
MILLVVFLIYVGYTCAFLPLLTGMVCGKLMKSMACLLRRDRDSLIVTRCIERGHSKKCEGIVFLPMLSYLRSQFAHSKTSFKQSL